MAAIVHYTSKFLTQPFHDGVTDAFITTGDLGRKNEIPKTGNRAFFSLTTATFWDDILTRNRYRRTRN
jgi:hypothetical protein